LDELRRREKSWDNFLFWGGFEMETHLGNKRKRTKNKSLTPQSSSIRKKAINPLQVEEPTSSSKQKKAKKKLVFNEATDQGKVKDKNILNLPYSDSESEPMVE
jgi:hypothetical protein